MDERHWIIAQAAKSLALENGNGCQPIAHGDGCPAIADGLPAIDHDVSMEASSSDAPKVTNVTTGTPEAKRTEASSFNAPPIDYSVRCVRCKRSCDPCTSQAIRYTKKSMGTFRCNTCNTRGTQLSRLESWQTLLGNWQNYSEVEKAQFWQDVGEAPNAESIKKVVEQRLTSMSIQRKKDQHGRRVLSTFLV